MNDRPAGGSVTPNATKLSALMRFFSSAVFRELAKKGRSPLFRRLLEQSDLEKSCDASATVGDVFDTAFAILKVTGLRDEYIYRTALTRKVLMGKHSLRTASMLNEFRVGSCKADLVILNGTATVYEIKSERDSLARLANQVRNYMQVFASVNVITSERHIGGVVAGVPDVVGVMCLSDRYSIQVVRDAADEPGRVSPIAVFESLRSAEAVAILKAMGVSVPKVPNTQLHAVMRALFEELAPTELHAEMVRTLKRSRNLAPLTDLVSQLPESLHAAALSIPVRRVERGRLVDAVTTPLGDTIAWV